MVVALALEEQRFLDYLANKICIRYHTERKLAFALIGLSAFFAMFMTNDVALLDFSSNNYNNREKRKV